MIDIGLHQNLVNGAIGLAKELVCEEIDFYPLLYYYEEGVIQSSTVANDSSDADYEVIIKQLVNSRKLVDYIYVMNDSKNRRFSINICMNGELYAPLFIHYKIDGTIVEFSELTENA